jgi:hypothetical protein
MLLRPQALPLDVAPQDLACVRSAVAVGAVAEEGAGEALEQLGENLRVRGYCLLRAREPDKAQAIRYCRSPLMVHTR